MQCAFCGATLKPDSKFCEQCGAEVAPANPPAALVSEDPIPEAFPYIDPSAQPVVPPVTGPVAECRQACAGHLRRCRRRRRAANSDQ